MSPEVLEVREAHKTAESLGTIFSIGEGDEQAGRDEDGAASDELAVLPEQTLRSIEEGSGLSVEIGRAHV